MLNTTFREHLLESEAKPSDGEVNVDNIEFTLKRTLGSILAKSGWVSGHKGTGIIAMIDADEDEPEMMYAEGVIMVNDFLHSKKLKTLKKGRVSGERVAEYRGATLSVIKTANAVKVLISK